VSYCDGATLEPRDLSIKGWGIGFGSNSGVGLCTSPNRLKENVRKLSC